MSIYAISDIHGCYNKYLSMLDKIALCDTDTLYVLGDSIDRGRGGIDVLLDMAGRRNVRPVIGNHESLALTVMKAIRDGAPYRHTKAYRIWLGVGGGATERAFLRLDGKERERVIDFIGAFSVYDELTVGENRFHLSHTLPSYDPRRALHEHTHLEFIWGEADYKVRYADGVYFVTGHKPTALIDPKYAGRILQKNGHVAIDCGAAFADAGGRLGCIRLDDFEEFYV